MSRLKGNVVGGVLGIGVLLMLGSGGDATAAVTSGHGEPMQVSGSEPSISFTIDPIARFDGQTGAASVSGTFTCDDAPLGARVFGDVIQVKGHRTTQQGFSVAIDPDACNGLPHEWSAQTLPFLGRRLTGGAAQVIANAEACRLFEGIFQCIPAPTQQVTIHLRGGG